MFHLSNQVSLPPLYCITARSILPDVEEELTVPLKYLSLYITHVKSSGAFVSTTRRFAR